MLAGCRQVFAVELQKTVQVGTRVAQESQNPLVQFLASRVESGIRTHLIAVKPVTMRSFTVGLVVIRPD